MHAHHCEEFLVTTASALQAARSARDFLARFSAILRRHFPLELCIVYFKEPEGNVFKPYSDNDMAGPLPLIPEEADLVESFTGRRESMVDGPRTRMYFELFDRGTQGLLARNGINLIIPLHARNYFHGLLLARINSRDMAAVRALTVAVQTAAIMFIPLIEAERLEFANDKNFYRLFKFDRLVLVGQMAASLAHELRTPLTTVLFEATAIKGRTKSDGAIVASCDKINREISRAGRLVESLLVFSKFKDLKLSHFPLREFVERTLVEIPAKKIPDSVAIRVRAEKEIRVASDSDRLKQVFMNVLFNALEAMASQRDGSIDIRIYSEYDELPRNIHHVIAIHDSGPGIPDAIKDRVLEPFFTTKKEGTGLGLYISYSIMKTLKGDLEIHSSGQGTQVNLILPVR
jgi:signal transduction histidine kinase